MSALCGARAWGINNGLTCGRRPHDVRVDPDHRFAPGDPSSLTWTDAETTPPATDPAAAAVELPPPAQVRYPVIPESERRPLGWLFAHRMGGRSR